MIVKAGLLASAAVFAVSSVSASAQDAQSTLTPEQKAKEAQANPDPQAAAAGEAQTKGATTTSDDTIVVTGSVARSLQQSMIKKRNSPVIIEAISVSDLNRLPDVSIADSISRLPGLTALRDPNNGDKSTISLRGMGAALTLGTLNGRDLATPNAERNVRYDQFPTELVGGVTVYKSPMASIVEGGVSGSIDIQTVKPLDYKKNTLAVSLLGSYNEAGAQFEPTKKYGVRGSISYIGRFLNDTVGVAIGYAARREPYNQLRNQHESFFVPTPGYGDLDQNGTMDEITYGLSANLTSGMDTRKGGFAIVEWRPSSKLHLTIDSLISRVKVNGQIYGLDTSTYYGGSLVNTTTQSWGNYNLGDPVGLEPWRANTYTDIVDQNDHLLAGTITNNGTQAYGLTLNPYAAISQRHDHLASIGGNLVWQPADRLSVLTDVAYSKATYNSDYWELRSQSLTQYDWGFWSTPNQSVTFNSLTNPPTWSTNLDVSDPSSFRPYSLTMPYLQVGSDKIFTYKNDLVYNLNSGFFDNFRFGWRYVDRTKTNRSGTVSAAIQAINNSFDPALNGSTYYGGRSAFLPGEIVSNPLGSYDGTLAGTFPQFFGFDFYAVADRIWGGLDTTQNDSTKTQSWAVNEKTLAGYGQLDFGGAGPLTGNIGVRVVRTRDRSSGFRNDPDFGVGPVTFRDNFTDVLPSLNATYHATRELQFRLGLAKTIARPPIEDLNPGYSAYNPGSGPIQAYGGNPNLKPYKANQADLGVEYYFGKNDYVALTGFYKQLDTYITTSTTTIPSGQVIPGTGISTGAYTFFQPVNQKGGHIDGFEVTFQKQFNELPAPLDGLGIYANYAYVTSNIMAGQNYTTTVLPLQGLAKHSGTAVLYYSKGPFAANVSYNYRGSLARVVDGGALETDDAASYLDAQASFEIRKGVQLVVQGQNLLNTPYKTYLDGNKNIRGRYAEYGRIFLAGIRANF